VDGYNELTMNKYFKNFNHYGRASLWMEEAKIREAKKQALQGFVVPQEEVVARRSHVIFSREDVHSPMLWLKHHLPKFFWPVTLGY